MFCQSSCASTYNNMSVLSYIGHLLSCKLVKLRRPALRTIEGNETSLYDMPYYPKHDLFDCLTHLTFDILQTHLYRNP